MRKFSPGDKAILEDIPISLRYGMPEEDLAAIRAAIGAEVEIVGFRRAHEAEVEFTAKDGSIHTIWVGVWWLRGSHGGERE